MLYTLVTVGPFAWIAVMRCATPEIFADPTGFPPGALGKISRRLVGSSYDVYFGNSLLVVGSAVAILTVVGAMAGTASARYRFTGNRFCYFLISVR